MNIKFDYGGKSVIVTGSAKGIGKEIATAYAKAGAKVDNCDISEPDGKAVVNEICSAGGNAALSELMLPMKNPYRTL